MSGKQLKFEREGEQDKCIVPVTRCFSKHQYQVFLPSPRGSRQMWYVMRHSISREILEALQSL